MKIKFGDRSLNLKAGGSLTNIDRGPRGYSAYEIAVQEGFVGTEEEWLASLVGPEGKQGKEGKRGIQGPRGQQGDKGDTGATGNGILSIQKTATADLVDIYTIMYANGSTTTFDVTNGKDGDCNFATFEIIDARLKMNKPDSLSQIDFKLNDRGHLEMEMSI